MERLLFLRKASVCTSRNKGVLDLSTHKTFLAFGACSWHALVKKHDWRLDPCVRVLCTPPDQTFPTWLNRFICREILHKPKINCMYADTMVSRRPKLLRIEFEFSSSIGCPACVVHTAGLLRALSAENWTRVKLVINAFILTIHNMYRKVCTAN